MIIFTNTHRTNSLTDADVVRVATRITTKQLADIDNLNKLARENKELFVQRLNEEAKKQKELEDERIRKLDKVLNEFTGLNSLVKAMPFRARL
ncbi:MAG: hypothetical protein WKG06_30795 [Segetibacter sp.]